MTMVDESTKPSTAAMPFGDGFIAFGTIRLYDIESTGSDGGATYIKGVNGDDIYPHVLVTAGLNKRWIRLDGLSVGTHDGITIVRVYLLPEDVGRSARGASSYVKEFRKLVKYLLNFVDCSKDAWFGSINPRAPIHTYEKPHMETEESLFYIFNTLQSPLVDFTKYKGDPYGRKAMEDALDSDIVGLKTLLYPYQRRSVAAMIQKEAGQAKIKDPRKTKISDIYENVFYCDFDDGVILQDVPLYFDTKGGILAETMGYGKTLICLALVLATRGHYPTVPEDCVETSTIPLSATTPSLLEMAARQLKHKGLPWKNEFFRLKKAGYHFDTCIAELIKYNRAYNEPMIGYVNPQRKGKPDYVNTIRLCSATLIVVPPNLIIQWQSEIKRHIEHDALDVLVIGTRDTVIPPWQQLVRYDIVLMSKSRFEQEYRDDELNTGNRSRYEAKYRSPLTEVRWLRVICDEGHGFAGSSSKTNAMAMLDKMFIERRWVVSGTPSSSLHGVEVGLDSIESTSDKQGMTSRRQSFGSTLKKRQAPVTDDVESRDLERLRLIVVNFLKLQPWANSKDDRADWRAYLAPRLDSAGVRYSMPALRHVMQTLIVRHKIQDVDYDLTLPPLRNKVVSIEPTYYDTISANLFVMLLITNYVTSEREDEDYMFHPRNRAKLNTLINNLTNATFYCISFTESDVRNAIRNGSKYLDDHIDTVADGDAIQLTQAIVSGDNAISDFGWHAFSTLHEMGTYVSDFPVHAQAAWSLIGSEGEPTLLGTTQAREIQRYVRTRLAKSASQDPCLSLSGAGVKSMKIVRDRAAEEQKQRDKTKSSSGDSQKEVGSSEGPQKRPPPVAASSSSSRQSSKSDHEKFDAYQTASNAYTLPDSQILGFASSKLTYIVNRVLHVHPLEKTIVFYGHNNTAFFIAEALELVGVSHLIYANTLSVRQRAEYLAQFNSNPSISVLLMDLKQAGQGLHVAAASRVYIVSPVWDGALESQAIKRAHRIGQTREVFVETLVLAGTIEEAVIKRRKKIRENGRAQSSDQTTDRKKRNNDSKGAAKSGHTMLDDRGMVKALKEINFLPHRHGAEKFARLDLPVRLFRDAKVDNADVLIAKTDCDSSDQHHEQLAKPNVVDEPISAHSPDRTSAPKFSPEFTASSNNAERSPPPSIFGRRHEGKTSPPPTLTSGPYVPVLYSPTSPAVTTPLEDLPNRPLKRTASNAFDDLNTEPETVST